MTDYYSIAFRTIPGFSQLSFGEQTAITNALHEAYKTGYVTGWKACVNDD